MSCPLYIPGNFVAYQPSVAYLQGAIRSIGDSVYVCTEAHTAGLGVDYSKWLMTRDIEYKITGDEWTANDNKVYKQFDVVENASTIYVCVQDNINTGQLITDTTVWQPINESCLIAENFFSPTEEWSAESYYGPRQVVSYNDKVWAFMLAVSKNNTEVPGTNADLQSGKEWTEITNDIVILDPASDNVQKTYDTNTSYSTNDKVEYDDFYWISRHDNNENNTPGETESWIAVHPKEPIVDISNPISWIADTYDWGDVVTNNNNTYTSRSYSNTEEPGTGTNWVLNTVDPTPDCSGQLAFIYNPNQSYQKDDVVNASGVFYKSLLDNNIYGLNNSDAWVLCGGSAPEPDCSTESLGYWSSENYYQTGDVVRVNDSYFIATQPNSGSFPYYSIAWELCKGSQTSTCEDVNTTNWDNATTYNPGDTVFYANAVYVCLDTNVNQQPDISTAWLQCSLSTYPTVSVPDNDYETLVFSETLKAFNQFYDFKSCLYMAINGKVYSYDTNLDEFVHQGGEPGAYHTTTPEKMVIRVVVNDAQQLRKYFDDIMTVADTNGIKFDKVTVRTNFDESGTQIINKADHTYKLREGVHTMPARELLGASRMIGNWIEVTYEITGVEGQPYVFRFISSDYLIRLSAKR